MTKKKATEPITPRLVSLNPTFTELLRDTDVDPNGFLGNRYPLYTSADDKLGTHEELRAARLQAENRPEVLVEATDLLSPGEPNERPEKWPHPQALPITGSIPRITSF